ncbi:MAG: DISARM system helicase DrmA, partial [Ktedonobacteraceae bacterium]
VFLDAPSPARLREMLEEMVVRDLLGPAGGEDEELLDDRVLERYLVGMLAPDRQQTVPEELEELSSADGGNREDGAPDSGVAQKASLSPSSFGMSFNVDYSATEIQVTARWGQYKKGESKSITTPKGHPARVWQRQQRSATRVIPLLEGPIASWRPVEDEQPEVFVKGLVRRSSNAWTVTLFLVNGQHEPKRLRDEAWLFQPELVVEAPDGSPIFRSRNGNYSSTHEERAMSMLYRHHVSFAVGHGVGVHAEMRPGDSTCATRLSTRAIPSYDVPRTEAPSAAELPALAGLVLDMKELAEVGEGPSLVEAGADVEMGGDPRGRLRASGVTLAERLVPLVTAYADWIEEQERHISDPAADLEAYRDVAIRALEQCRKTLRRIQQGIDMLASNDDATRAFRFMNRAMWQQRIHTLYAEARRRGNVVTLEQLDISVNRSWRPFQLAFILLNLPALSDLHSPERGTDSGAVADLLWFPTGGGKTEAYLGLTAFTIAIRRLQGEVAGRSGQDGVAVIMRYTLRLLTLQQFQRASSLMCACELIRRAESEMWGETPFRLGLWVGQRSTPNTTQESAEAIRLDHGLRGGKGFGGYGSMGNVGNPRQLTHCPWCGSPIEGGRHIEVESYGSGRGRTLIYCGDAYGQCAFSKAKAPGEGLPVLVVDEEIYRLLPALLIATVDKFAQLPWKGETQMLFGQVEKRCERHGFRAADIEDRDAHTAHGSFPRAISRPHQPLRPPDLIIQDELHLISGPLGTLVGLYETGIDSLCTWEVDGRQVRPKVIAATATIRRAGQQVEALFLRKVEIFPPQGLDVEDNFFSRQRPPGEDAPGRRYLGICANGRRLKAALIRVYIAYLASAQALYEKYGAAADPYMTLVGYFNSMSELGGMRRLVDDDVSTRLWKMDQRGLAKRSHPIVEELTSRKSSSMIPEVLSRLELAFGGNGEMRPIDVLLATNMISVGVDVQRLGLMVVTGQPKTTAEYIQATSRVGRNAPGLVCTVFNWSRPRDLSHYEQFEHYHATFYQQVEALSVTPFAPRALDRGLAALLTSYVRLAGTELSPNAAAGDVNATTSSFARAREQIARRAEEITSSPEVAQRVRVELDRLQAYWVRQAATVPALGYKKRNDSRTLGLLQSPEQGRWEPFTCLNSLRDVEPGIHLILDERGLGEEEHA